MPLLDKILYLSAYAASSQIRDQSSSQERAKKKKKKKTNNLASNLNTPQAFSFVRCQVTLHNDLPPACSNNIMTDHQQIN